MSQSLVSKNPLARFAFATGLLAFAVTSAQAQTSETTVPTPATSTTLVAAPEAKKEEKNPTSLSLSAGFVGSSKEDEYINSKYFGGTIDVSGSRKLTEKLEARLGVSFMSTSGSFTNRYGSEGSAPGFMSLGQAVIEYKPIDELALQAGIVETSFAPISTLGGNGFPGLRQDLSLSGEILKGSLFALQGIPVSSTPAVKTNEGGLTTTFFAAGADISTNPKDEGRLTLGASLMRFEFRDLNSSAANDSKYKGNTVLPVSQARFQYEFAGSEVGANLKLKLTDETSVRLTGSYLKNDLAPAGANQGYVYQAGLTTPALSGKLTSTVGYFYNESDTLPAAYVNSSRGYNDRFGHYLKFKHSLPKEKITSFFNYTRVNEITDRPERADRDQFSFGLEVEYEIL